MKSVVLLCVFATSALGHPARPKTVPTTRVTGESWLNHLHRAFEERLRMAAHQHRGLGREAQPVVGVDPAEHLHAAHGDDAQANLVAHQHQRTG